MFNMFKRAILLSGIFLLATCSLTFGQPAPLWETGQTTCYDTSGVVISCAGTGQDGELKAGVAWPNPRLTASGECVIDNLTGLMWAKNANLPNGTRTWQGALDYVASLNSGSGLCGHKDWRLPNRKEIRSLIDYSHYTPALPLNNPFINVQSNLYWSSSSSAKVTSGAWGVNMWNGGVEGDYKGNSNYVWPVRSGQGGSFGPLDHFEFSTISSAQTVGVPFSVTITAKDANGNTVTDFIGSVSLSATVGNVTPSTINLVSGVWNGNISLDTIGNSIQITAGAGGKQGQSNAFTVGLPANNGAIYLPLIIRN